METIFSEKAWDCQPLIGVSENINSVREMIDRVASSGFNVIITGETGVGKDVAAQNLHYRSRRRDKPFVKINCAAVPEGLLESELFGYEAGAFTGATSKRRGKFELSHGGVLFLDEIGDMSMMLQSKLLHVLQSGEFSPLGSESDLKTDTWTIAATNHHLEKRIENKKFRLDLYYRLNTINIHISPLRERPEDIPCLIEFFMEKYKKRFKGKKTIEFTPKLMDKMQMYNWPGNVRELQNVLKRMMVIGAPEKIMDELIRNNTLVVPGGSRVAPNRADDGQFDLFDMSLVDPLDLEEGAPLKEITKKALARIEKKLILHALGKTKWNRTWAAKILNVSYKTVLNKIKEFDIELPADIVHSS
ncbi:MAG: sigma-54-dependent Fis family transcriptional regulator [Desulfobacterales bacterium]|nr:sigma-54-dependent Fis family transcriptional regulator [Desulfobacterales bacterium]